MTTPTITIFVRHSPGCKYAGDEFAKRCDCRKHLRWTLKGKQHRRKAGTRTWAEAEAKKRDLEDQLAGRAKPDAATSAAEIRASVAVFIEDKRVQGISGDVVAKYVRELQRLVEHCERHGVYAVQGITRELLTGYCATWPSVYPSTQTRSAVRTRCRGFLRYCYESQWIPRVPLLPKIRVDEAPTMPLNTEEFARLLEATATLSSPEPPRKVRAVVLLMRWSGLAIRDTLTLPKSALIRNGHYRVVTARQKTGTDVSVVLPPDVAEEILTVKNSGPFLFWDGESDIVKTWTKYVFAPLFKAAEIERAGNTMTHRLRDTFAVSLLEQGVPLESVSKLLGHESIKTTERHYAKWVKGRQDRLDNQVSGTW